MAEATTVASPRARATCSTRPVRCGRSPWAARAATGAALVLAAGTAAGCGAAGGPTASAPAPQVREQDLRGMPLLADAGGRTLYLFAPDRHTAVTCVQTCQGNWPPLVAAGGRPPTAGPGVDARLLGTAVNPDGGRVVTYHGWPLYTYAGDGGPGRLRGQALELNGGLWYAVTTTGQPV